MVKVLTNALGVILVLALSLHLWRVFYPATDWAVLALLPLAALVFIGSLSARAAVYRASMEAAVRRDSSFAWMMTGKLRAVLGSTAFTLVALVLLAWQALSSTAPELFLLALLCFVASILFAGIEHKLLGHLTPPFARACALSAATIIAAIFFIPILAWANWSFTLHPGEIRTVSLQEALQLGFSHLPARRGWVAELLAPLYALEYAKLWFAVQGESPKWFSAWYSIDSALVSIVAARASTVLMYRAQVTRAVVDEKKISC